MELFLYSSTRLHGVILIKQTDGLNLFKNSSVSSLIAYGLDDGGFWVRLAVKAETLVFLTVCACACVRACVVVFRVPSGLLSVVSFARYKTAGA